MRLLASYRDELPSLDEKAFLQKYPDPVLVFASSFEAPTAPASFYTTRIGDLDAMRMSRLRALSESADVCVMPVVKAGRNPYIDRVFVGRSQTNDIVIRHRSVSKSHAYFERRAGTEEAFGLVDASSRNGTTVEGKPLAPSTYTPLADTASIAFGTCSIHYVVAGEFYRFLRSMAGMRRPAPR